MPQNNKDRADFRPNGNSHFFKPANDKSPPKDADSHMVRIRDCFRALEYRREDLAIEQDTQRIG